MHDFQRLMQIAAAAESLPETERDAFLERECAGDQVLLKAVRERLAANATSAGSAAKPSVVEPTTTADFMSTPGAGTIIGGRYTLVEKIGEGGMGEVWVARQSEPVKRNVAVKLIKGGAAPRTAIHRFEQERQALALMDHPFIARIFDGGLAENGQPFFVMELVAGRPLTAFCDQARLSINDRLDLFVQVCQAVQHAHQKGIIHRDLTPRNILVSVVDGKPLPKVIDFGLAKAVGGKITEDSVSTQFGAVVGTLEYMSPEQAGLSIHDVDTRADIYALGVILYELLTGLPPFDRRRLRKAALDEMLRVIRDEEPPSLSSRLSSDDSLPSAAAVRGLEPQKLLLLVKGELDWIVHRCLEKDRSRRYETASGLARDVQRYLTDEPVEARPVSAGYRFKKFLRRHRGPVVTSAILFIAITGFGIGTALALVRATRAEAEWAKQAHLAGERLIDVEREQTKTQEQKTRAEENERKAVAESQRAGAKEREATVHAAARRFLQEEFLNQGPWQRAKLRRTTGTGAKGDPRNPTYKELLDGAATRMMQPAFLNQFREQPRIYTEVMTTAADAYQSLGEFDRAIALLNAALANNLRLDAPDETAIIACRCRLAAANFRALRPRVAAVEAVKLLSIIEKNIVSTDAGKLSVSDRTQRFDRGVRQLDTLLEILQEQISEQPVVNLDDLEIADLAVIGFILTPAAASVERMLPLLESRFGASDHRGRILRMFRAFVYEALKNKRQAETLFQSSLEAFGDDSGAHFVWSMFARVNLARLLMERGKFDEAAGHFERLLKQITDRLGVDHPHCASVKVALGRAYAYSGRGSKAIELLEPATQQLNGLLGMDHPDALSALGALGVAYRVGGRPNDAISVLEQVRKARQRQPDHPETLNDLFGLAQAYRSAGRLREAIALLEHVRDARLRLRADDPDLLSDYDALAAAYREAGRLAESIALHQKAAEGVKMLGYVHDDAGGIIQRAADALEADGQLAAAEGWRRNWVAEAKQSSGPESIDFADALATFGMTLLRQRKFREAELALHESHVIRRRKEPNEWTTFDVQSHLGAALSGQKKYAEAEPLLVKGYEGIKARETSIPNAVGGKRCVSQALDRLIDLYIATNKPEEVKKWRAERAK